MNPELERRYARIPEFGNRVLRVVSTLGTNPIRIVTVHFDRRKSAP